MHFAHILIGILLIMQSCFACGKSGFSTSRALQLHFQKCKQVNVFSTESRRIAKAAKKRERRETGSQKAKILHVEGEEATEERASLRESLNQVRCAMSS